MADPYAEFRDERMEALGGLPQLTWFSHEPLGHYSSLSTVSSGPIAILAGFTLASGVALATTPGLESLDIVALGTFGVSAACLFVALAMVVEASSYFSKPGDRLEWFPEASISRSFLLVQRQRQRDDFLRYDSFRRRALQWYSGGASLALMALALVLLGRVDGTSVRLALDEDTLLDSAAIVGAVGVVCAALYLLSLAPYTFLGGLAEWRGARTLRRARHRWPNLDTVDSTDLIDAGSLREWRSRS